MTKKTPVRPMRPEDYAGRYSEAGLSSALRRFAHRGGRRLLTLVFTLRYAIVDPNVPAWAKATAMGALGYFITPLDMIPDFTPIAGLSDDMGVLAAAVAAIAAYAGPETRAKARMATDRVLGPQVETPEEDRPAA